MPRFKQPDVGVGADNPIEGIGEWVRTRFFEDEEARRRRELLEDQARAQALRDQGMQEQQATSRVQQERQFTPDPGRWIQERAEDVRRNPIVGSLRSLGALPEAAGTAARYATGALAMPAVQAGAERYGFDLGGEVQRRFGETENMPGAGLPVFGGAIRGAAGAAGLASDFLGTAARVGTDLATGNVPAPRGSLAGQRLQDSGFWETPVPEWENPFDPREALQRNRALAGPGEIGLDLTAGGVPFGMFGKAANAIAGRTVGGMLPDTTRLGSIYDNPIGAFFAPGRGALGATIPPVVGGVAGAISPITGKPVEDTTIEDRLLGAGEGFLAGGILGMVASPLERRLLNVAGPRWAQSIDQDVAAQIRNLPGGNTFVDERLPAMLRANAEGQGYTGGAVTPGGAPQRWWDSVMRAWMDPLKPLGTLQDYLDSAVIAKVASTGASLPVIGDAYRTMSLSRQSRKIADGIIAETTKDLGKGGAYGTIYGGEESLFNVYGLLTSMETAARTDNFMGPYRELFKHFATPGVGKALGSSIARDEILNDKKLLMQAVQAQFPDRPDILQRFEQTRSALSEMNNRALDYMEGAGVLRPGMAAELRNRYGDQWGLLEEAGTQYTAITSRTGPGKDYLARQDEVGFFHQSSDLPMYTIGGHLQRVRDAVALAEHNKGANILARFVDELTDVNPVTGERVAGIPGLIEWNRKVPRPVPGPSYNEHIMRGPNGQPILDANGDPVKIKELRPVTNMAMQYDRHVSNDMGIIPLWRDGEWRELLVEKSIAETLNGATVEKHNAATGILAAQAQIFKHGVTALAPMFWAMHGIRQFQEFVEKVPRGQMNLAMSALFHGYYGTITQPMAEWVAQNPNHPAARAMATGAARALDRVLGRNGVDRVVADLFHKSGGGASSLPTAVGREQAALETLGIKESPNAIKNFMHVPSGAHMPSGPMKLIHSYEDAMQTLTSLFDEAPRIASFDLSLRTTPEKLAAPRGSPLWRQGQQELRHPTEAGYLSASIDTQRMETARYEAQTATNDYSRMGTTMALVNQFLPLLNARKEGFLTSVGGAVQDPQRFAARMNMMVGLPLTATYAANRLVYGEAYDDIPIDEKDLYFHIPYGWWQDENGHDHPLTIKIVKSPFVQAIAAPIEHLLDSQYHLARDHEYLASGNRTSRPDSRMFLTQLIRMSPIEGSPDAFSDVKHMAMTAASLQPAMSMIAELAANEDHFTGRAIVDPERQMLPAQYQYSPWNSSTAKFLGKYVPISPAYLDKIAEDMFGTAGRSAMHMPDLAVNILQKHGLVEKGDPFRPTTPDDLPSLAGMPAEIVNRYLDELNHEDLRPWQGQFLPRFFGTAYSGRAIRERARQLGPHEREMWEHSLEYDRRRNEISIRMSQERYELEQQAPDITNAQYRDKMWQLTMKEKGMRQELADVYRGKAWVEPEEREAAIAHLPGVNADNFRRTLPNLPPGTDVATLAQQWEEMGQAGNPTTVASTRNQWLRQQSNALHVSPSVILDYMGAHHLGNELVGLPVPVEDVDRVRAEYRAPMDPKDPQRQLDPFTTPMDKFRDAQRNTITKYSQMWGVTEDQLLERMNARYHLPGEVVGPVQAAQQNAQMMETRFHNPKEYPRYSSPSGQAVGTPDDWEVWDGQLSDAINKYGTSRNKWPRNIRILDDARRYGEAHRYLDMYKHATEGTPEEREQGLKNLMDWERFYGTGRSATLSQWESFVSDGQTKYRPRPGQTITPQTAMAWDAMYQLYRLLPPGREKNQYRPFAERIRRQMNPRWQRLIDLRDEAGDELRQT